MNFSDIDFNRLFQDEKEDSTFPRKTEGDWDAVAEKFNKGWVEPGHYVNNFIARMDLSACESLLDVGCGSGALAIPLAQKLKTVYCLDFSYKMLELLKQNAKAKKIDNLKTFKKEWKDSWEEIPEVDIVIASRSTGPGCIDMAKAMQKLNQMAKKRVYLTYLVGGFFVDKTILDYIGRKQKAHPDYIYVVNILYQMGINARVDFIEPDPKNRRKSETLEGFLSLLRWKLRNFTVSEEKKATDYYNEFINQDLSRAPAGFHWAFISWEKR
ncbi:methyltransferase domain-containing protein [Candidatus Riflebacteria bacterium]